MASYEVRQIEGKGQGLVATKHITSGSLMLSDQPLLTVHSASSTNTDIEDAFCNVRKQDQDFYLTLYEGRSNYPHESKIVRIFNSNHFGTEQSKFVLPLIARLNNSCVANAAVIDSTLRAQKTIQVGEEITICYRETWDEVLTASQRNLMFKYRKLIGFNDHDTSRTIIRKAHWPPRVPTTSPIRNASQRIEFTLLLAKLREAEGLGNMRVATTYFEAASLLLDLQMRYLNLNLIPNRHIWFPEAARCCVAWMQKAVEYAAIGGGHIGETVERYRSDLHGMQTDPNSIVTATLVMAGPDDSGGVQAKKCYALLVDVKMKDMYKRLTLQQSEELLGIGRVGL